MVRVQTANAVPSPDPTGTGFLFWRLQPVISSRTSTSAMSTRPAHHTNDTKSGFCNPWISGESTSSTETGSSESEKRESPPDSGFNASNWILPSFLSQGWGAFPLEWAKEHPDHPHPPVKVVKPSFDRAVSDDGYPSKLMATWLGHAVRYIIDSRCAMSESRNIELSCRTPLQ